MRSDPFLIDAIDWQKEAAFHAEVARNNLFAIIGKRPWGSRSIELGWQAMATRFQLEARLSARAARVSMGLEPYGGDD